MRKFAWMLTIVIGVSVFLAGCGTKNAEDIVKELGSKLDGMKSYKAAGSMVLYTGEDPQQYNVEVWYQVPSYYRIKLTSEEKDITQIILRNDEGVFVLTPHLKKSFRFQSDWPDRQGQVYLYQTLAKSILDDPNRQFALDDKSKAYVFDVAANYENNASLVRQKIWLDKDGYAPKQVVVNDEQNQAVVEVKFSDFSFDKGFNKDDFEMERNLTSWDIQSMPTLAEVEIGEKDEAGAEQSLALIEPMYMPEGVSQLDMMDVTLGGKEAVLIRYQGEYNYSIIESRPIEQMVSTTYGEMIDLGMDTLGILTGKQMKTLYWLMEGMEFRLSSDDLPVSEMVKVAQSMQNQTGK